MNQQLTFHSQWIAADVTVEEAERLLLTEFYEHEHVHSSSIRAGCDKYRF